MKNQFGDKFPDDVVNALARMLLPEIQKAYESAEGQAEFEKWKAEQADSQTDKHNPKKLNKVLPRQLFFRIDCRG